MIGGGRCGRRRGRRPRIQRNTPGMSPTRRVTLEEVTRASQSKMPEFTAGLYCWTQANDNIRSPRDVRMHVAPIDLRAVQQDGLKIRFALLDSMAYVLAEAPGSGSSGTSLEQPCVQPHWGMVIAGELRFVTARRRPAVPAGGGFPPRAGGRGHPFWAARPGPGGGGPPAA